MDCAMKPEAQVDVIIPCYRGDAYAQECLAGLLGQTHAAWKAWVIDDGSPADSARRLDDVMFGFGDDRIRVLKQANAGVAAARNAGVIAGNAPFVAFLDIDDIWAPDKLQRQLAVLQISPATVAVYCDYETFDGKSVTPGAVEPTLRGSIAPALLREGNRVSGSASAVLARRVALEAAGPFDETLRLGEDWELWIRLARQGDFDFVDEPLVRIRRHAASAQGAQDLSDGYEEMTEELLAQVSIVGRHAPELLPEGALDSQSVARLRRAARRLAKRRLTFSEIVRLRAELRKTSALGEATARALAPAKLLSCLPWIALRSAFAPSASTGGAGQS